MNQRKKEENMKVLKWLDKHLEEVILITLLCLIVLVMLYQIIRRYVFNSSLTLKSSWHRSSY